MIEGAEEYYTTLIHLSFNVRSLQKKPHVPQTEPHVLSQGHWNIGVTL